MLETILIILAAIVLIAAVVIIVVLIKKEFGQMQGQMTQFEERLNNFSATTEERLNNFNATTEERLNNFSTNTQGRINDLSTNVNKRLEDSFKNVHEQLINVEKSVGEMRSLAHNVDDLRSIMSNTKTRGIIGEYQLGSIISDSLNHAQYETEFATVPGSRERVEFALKLPTENDNHVYLPVDAKFPADSYQAVLDARESGDRQATENALKNLRLTLRNEANDIATKYIAPPHTTPYGVAYLPSEGLFAECINLGLLEELQKDYNVTIAGPSTMGVLINSIQMMYKTVAMQKRSSEVWEVLESIKTEFAKYEAALTKAQKQIRTAEGTVSDLLSTRTNQMNRRLRMVDEVKKLDEGDSE